MKLQNLIENINTKSVTGTFYRGGQEERDVTITVDCSEGEPYDSGILGCRVVSVGGRLAKRVIQRGALVDYSTEKGPAVLDAVENAWVIS